MDSVTALRTDDLTNISHQFHCDMPIQFNVDIDKLFSVSQYQIRHASNVCGAT